MKLTIELTLDNAAFRDEDGCPNAYAIGLKVEDIGKDLFYKGLPVDGDVKRVQDDNGNTTGRYYISYED